MLLTRSSIGVLGAVMTSSRKVLVISGAGRAARSTFPLEVIGSASNRTKVGGTMISWHLENAGTSTRYDIATGRVSSLRTPSEFSVGTCLANDRLSSPFADTQPSPPAGDAYYYMTRAQNACGTSTYGTALRDAHGSSGSSCP